MKLAGWPRLQRQCPEIRGEKGKRVNHIHSQIELIIVGWSTGGRNPTGARLKAREKMTEKKRRQRLETGTGIWQSSGLLESELKRIPSGFLGGHTFCFSWLQSYAAAIGSQVSRFVLQPPRRSKAHFHLQTPEEKTRSVGLGM